MDTIMSEAAWTSHDPVSVKKRRTASVYLDDVDSLGVRKIPYVIEIGRAVKPIGGVK